jgi:hypothetical protein
MAAAKDCERTSCRSISIISDDIFSCVIVYRNVGLMIN